MRCENCGYILSVDWNVCPMCSKVINAKSIYDQNEQHPINIDITQKPHYGARTEWDDKEKNESSNTEKTFIKVFLASFALSIIFSILGLHFIPMLCSLIALVTIVTAYIKFPKNRTIKILFWIFVGLAVLFIIVLLLTAVFCIHFINEVLSF